MNTSEKLEQLSDVVTDGELDSLQTLSISVDRALQKQDEKQAKKARAELDKAVTRLFNRYFFDAETLKNRTAVVRYLENLGYKVSSSKLYQDSDTKHERRLLRVQDNGGVLIADVKNYAAAHLRKLSDDGSAHEDMLDMKRQELKYKIIHRKNTCREQDFAYERLLGKYVAKDQLERELATRAAALDAGLSAMVREKASIWIELVGGDATKIPELIEMFKAHKDELLRDYAQTETLEVLFHMDG